MNSICIDIGWSESCQIEKFKSFFFIILLVVVIERENIFYVFLFMEIGREIVNEN